MFAQANVNCPSNSDRDSDFDSDSDAWSDEDEPSPNQNTSSGRKNPAQHDTPPPVPSTPPPQVLQNPVPVNQPSNNPIDHPDNKGGLVADRVAQFGGAPKSTAYKPAQPADENDSHNRVASYANKWAVKLSKTPGSNIDIDVQNKDGMHPLQTNVSDK